MDGCKYISQVGQIYLAILTNIICTFDEWRDSQGKCQVCGKMEGSTKTVHTVDIHEGCYLAIMTQNTHFFSCSSLFLIRTSGDSHNQAGFKHINTYQACKGQLHLILSIKDCAMPRISQSGPPKGGKDGVNAWIQYIAPYGRKDPSWQLKHQRVKACWRQISLQSFNIYVFGFL